MFLNPKKPNYEFPIFTEEGHIYKDKNGIILPSITQIISGIKEYEGNYNETNQEWGKARHMVCQLYDEKDLDESTVSEDLKPALEAWKKFVNETKFEPMLIEQPLMHQTLRFCGTPDRYGKCFGLLSVVEIKPNFISRRVPYQTAGQQMLIEDLGYKVESRFSVHISDDGTYALSEHKDWRQIEIFRSLLTVCNAQMEVK